MRGSTSRSGQVGAGAVLLIAQSSSPLAIGLSEQTTSTPEIGTGCLVRGAGFDVPLSTGQAGIASTIAGVASFRAMPVRAVTIAYATALQESDLENLPYGDRDSVGVFQQRPSQGWGTREELLNPVYATTRFFAALAAIPGYQRLPIYQAAQDVQRSADGSAYEPVRRPGRRPWPRVRGLAGQIVWCWYGDTAPIMTGQPQGARCRRAGPATGQAAFGPLRVSPSATRS